jgi:hypothetical protein
MIPPSAPCVGLAVLYCPPAGEDFSGGAVRLPAIVVAVNGTAPDYLPLLAVTDQTGRLVMRSRPISAETWEARGCDPDVPHWRYCEPS